MISSVLYCFQLSAILFIFCFTQYPNFWPLSPYFIFPMIRRWEPDTESLSHPPSTNGSKEKSRRYAEEDQNLRSTHYWHQSGSGNFHQGKQQQAQPGSIFPGDDEEPLGNFSAPRVQIRPDQLQQWALRHVCSIRRGCVQPGRLNNTDIQSTADQPVKSNFIYLFFKLFFRFPSRKKMTRTRIRLKHCKW